MRASSFCQSAEVVRLEHRPADAFLDRLLEEQEQPADVDVLPVRVASTVVRAPQSDRPAAALEDAEHVDALAVELPLLDVAEDARRRPRRRPSRWPAPCGRRASCRCARTRRRLTRRRNENRRTCGRGHDLQPRIIERCKSAGILHRRPHRLGAVGVQPGFGVEHRDTVAHEQAVADHILLDGRVFGVVEADGVGHRDHVDVVDVAEGIRAQRRNACCRRWVNPRRRRRRASSPRSWPEPRRATASRAAGEPA